MISFKKHVRLQAYLIILAVPLNLVWEVGQISAYDFPESSLITNVLACFLPTLRDGLMILIIYWAGWSLFRNPQWILNPGLKGYLLMMGIGLFFLLALILVARSIMNASCETSLN